MYKSPVKIIQDKKTSINFIKTLGSPKSYQKSPQPQTTKHIYTQHQSNILKFNKSSNTYNISLELTLQKQRTIIRCTFSYTNNTKIQQLLDFIKKQVGITHIVIKTKTLFLDYYMTLTNRYVKQLGVKKMQMTISKIKIMKNDNLLVNLQIIKCIGTGGFSKVYLVRGYGKIMALKVINKDFIIQNQKQNIIQNQRKILQKCSNHPFITQLYLSFQTKNYLFFAMQYCNGGQLFNLLRKVRKMTQQQSKFYFLQTLTAINHLHSQNILYRDLKPQNIILDNQGHVRLADYGLSKIMKDNMTHSFCGSAQYMAPQMLMKKGHSYQIDYYCLGALLYQLLTGLPPYYSKNQDQLFQNIIKNQLQFPDHVQLSKQLRKMLMRLLQKNTDLRFKKVQDILNHPWLKNINIQDILDKKLEPPFKTQMFQTNYDDTDFADEQISQIFKLEHQKQKDIGNISYQQQQFKDFLYICDEFLTLELQLQKKQQKKLDFTKKDNHNVNHNVNINQIYPRQTLIRNMSMKSIDNSQIFDYSINQKQIKDRGNYNYHRSSDKFKNVITNSFNQYPSTINHDYHSVLNTSNKLSEINLSKVLEHGRSNQKIIGHQSKLMGHDSKLIGHDSKLLGHDSKLMNVRSVPIMQKNHILSRGNERIGSPININNYINIYTSKSPSNQINFNTNHYGLPTKKSINFQNSYQKSINPNHQPSTLAHKQSPQTYEHPNHKKITLLLDNSHNNLNIQRSKFNSVQKVIKPVNLLSHNNSQNYIRTNVHGQVSYGQINRGYLSNYKERLNGGKVKKFYRPGQKQNMHFIGQNNTYKH